MPSRSRRSHFNQRVSALTTRLDRHKLGLGIAASLVGLFLIYIAAVSVNGPPFQSRYEVTARIPGDAPILKRGDAVRVAGRLAGLITEVEPGSARGPGSARESIEVTARLRPEFAPIGSDATANVRVKSIVYQTYLEIFPGDAGDPIADGGEIPPERVTSGVDLLEVVELFDEGARNALRRSLVLGGYGLAGRGEALNEMLGALPETTERGARQLRAATREPGAIGELIAGAAGLASGLEGYRADDVEGLIDSGAATFGTIAARGTELAETIRLLPPFEDELLRTAPLAEPLLDDSARLAAELTPVVDDLNGALPALNRLLGEGEELRTETERLTDLGEPLLRASRPLVRAAYPTAASLDPLFTATDEVVSTLEPYERDIELAGRYMTEATSHYYPSGQTAPGNPALRFVPVLTCHNNRNPFPEPGESRTDSAPC